MTEYEFKQLLINPEEVICNYKALCGWEGHYVNNNIDKVYAIYAEIEAQVDPNRISLLYPQPYIICKKCFYLCRYYNGSRPIYVLATVLNGKFKKHQGFKTKI